MINKLEKEILDQHQRVADAGQIDLENMATLLDDASGYIVHQAENNKSEAYWLFDDRRNRSELQRRGWGVASESPEGRSVRTAGLAAALPDFAPRLIMRNQGYIGGVVGKGDDRMVFGYGLSAPSPRSMMPLVDPIQDAINKHEGGYFYPAMAWVKALRAVGYMQRPDNAADLRMEDYLSQMGMHLGSAVIDGGSHDVVGATGFMPAHQMRESLMEDDTVRKYAEREKIEVFRLSGLMDQAVIDLGFMEGLDMRSIHTRPSEIARRLVDEGVNLN